MFIAGFPGIGKTHYCNNNPLPTHDSDSSKYSKLSDGTPNPNFIVDYFRELEQLNAIPGVMILVSTHAEVLAELKRRNLDYYVVIPEVGLIGEYVKRYEQRGSPNAFITLIIDNWHMWLADIKTKHQYFELKSGQTLTDFMVETYETAHDPVNAMANVALKK